MKTKLLLTCALLNAMLLLSQTGPGGVGNSSNNGLWLKASDISQINSSSVLNWMDASGNGNNAFQDSIGIQPLYFNSSAINGMPIVRLDGAGDELIIADSPILDGTAGITYYAVIRPNNLNGGPKGILGKRIDYMTAIDYAYTWFFWTGNMLHLDVETNNNRFTTGSTTYNNNTNYLLSWNFDGTKAPAERSTMRAGSTEIISSFETSSSIMDSNQDLILGALNSNYGNYLGADYAELIQFNYALDSVEHVIIQNYLSAKYDIGISSMDIYDEDETANGNYDFEVAGIGRISATAVQDEAQGDGLVRILNPTDLNDDEFLVWGHDNAEMIGTNFTDIPAIIDARVARVWRVSEVDSSQNAIDVGSIDIQFDLNGFYSTTASDLALLVDTDNDGNFSDETPISGAIDLGSNIFEFSGVTALANNLRFTLGTFNVAQTSLPVEFMQFSAYPQYNRIVKLDWQTATEINNAYFTVERSRDGLNWEIVNTISGAGTSTTPLSYTSIDESPYSGRSFYRLKQTDFSEAFTYSKVKIVHLDQSENTLLAIYPNPATDQINIVLQETELEIDLSKFKIYNTVGQDVTPRTQIIKQNYSNLKVDISALNTGLYYVKFKNSVNNFYRKN